jgi:hypothetical protein
MFCHVDNECAGASPHPQGRTAVSKVRANPQIRGSRFTHVLSTLRRTRRRVDIILAKRVCPQLEVVPQALIYLIESRFGGR